MAVLVRDSGAVLSAYSSILSHALVRCFKVLCNLGFIKKDPTVLHLTTLSVERYFLSSAGKIN